MDVKVNFIRTGTAKIKGSMNVDPASLPVGGDNIAAFGRVWRVDKVIKVYDAGLQCATVYIGQPSPGLYIAPDILPKKDKRCSVVKLSNMDSFVAEYVNDGKMPCWLLYDGSVRPLYGTLWEYQDE